jgi:hypothetical protein
MLHIHLPSGAGTTNQLLADEPCGLSLTPLHGKNKTSQKPPEAGGELSYLPVCFMLVSCSAYYLTVKMEDTCSSETLGSSDYQKTIHFTVNADKTSNLTQNKSII